MKILQLISSAGQYGAENLLLELSTALQKFGCGVIVGVIENKNRRSLEVFQQAKERGLDAQLILRTGKFDREAIRQVESFIRENGIDLVHTHGYKSDLYGYWAARRTGVATVATCHGWPGSSFTLRIYYLLDKIALCKFDRLIAVSETNAVALRRAAIPNRKISLIANGIDTTRFQNCKATRKTENLASSGKRIGVVARLAPEKGLPYLLEAAKGVLREFPDTEFCLVGDGPERGRLELLARKLGIERNVEFWGSRTDMPAVYAQLDLFVLPSLQESLPMAILEAMAAGIPVIATRVGAVPEVVIPEQTGVLVDAGNAPGLRDAILRYLKDPKSASEFGKNGAGHVRRSYSATAMAHNYLDVYRELLQQRRPDKVHAQQEA